MTTSVDPRQDVVETLGEVRPKRVDFRRRRQFPVERLALGGERLELAVGARLRGEPTDLLDGRTAEDADGRQHATVKDDERSVRRDRCRRRQPLTPLVPDAAAVASVTVEVLVHKLVAVEETALVVDEP